MENISARTKLGHHDSSDEEPNSPATKKPASGSPASGRDGTPMLTGTGRGEPSPIRPPDNEKRKAQIKPSKQSQ